MDGRQRGLCESVAMAQIEPAPVVDGEWRQGYIPYDEARIAVVSGNTREKFVCRARRAVRFASTLPKG